MQASMFNVRVPLDRSAAADDVFLMNTFTDAQRGRVADVASLLDRLADGGGRRSGLTRRGTARRCATLAEHGFIVPSRAEERQPARSVLPGSPGRRATSSASRS